MIAFLRMVEGGDGERSCAAVFYVASDADTDNSWQLRSLRFWLGAEGDVE